LSASIAFEQSYEQVEGDSASVAEMCALLSSLADIPIKQNLAVTGSLNQRGEVQAVGGVTSKIEGFFATCKVKGPTGQQGVAIPEANVRHLMLKPEVVEAVRDGKFHVYAVKTIDEAMEMLTGAPAGERGPEGAFPPETVNARVEDRLRRFAERAAELAARGACRAGGGLPGRRRPAGRGRITGRRVPGPRPAGAGRAALGLVPCQLWSE